MFGVPKTQHYLLRCVVTKNPPKITCPCTVKQVAGCGTTTEALPADPMPLSSACGQEKFKICKINGDRKVCARMAQFGVLPGSEIELICPGHSKQCMVRVKGSTFTLDQLCARNILVTPA